MKIGIFTALFGDWPLSQVASHVADLGYEAVELLVGQEIRISIFHRCSQAPEGKSANFFPTEGFSSRRSTMGWQASFPWARTTPAPIAGRRA